MPDGSGSRFLLAAIVALVLGAVGGLLAAWATRRDPVPAVRFVPPREEPASFRLRDQDGRWASPRDARGQVLVLTFLYSTCRDLCPRQAAEIRDAVLRVGNGVQVYGVSVDPVGDTPERARSFLRRFHLYGGPVRFLVGSRRELRPVWSTYGIVPIAATPAEAAAAAAAHDRLTGAGGAETAASEARRRRELAARPAPDAAYQPYPDVGDLRFRGRPRHVRGLDFEHSAYVMLIDKRGRQRVGFPFEQLDAGQLERDMRLLRDER
jgi:protein SCO1/2